MQHSTQLLPRCAWKEAQYLGQGMGEGGAEVLKEILDSEMGKPGGGVCLLVINTVDSLDTCVNVRLPCNPCHFSE